MHTQREEMGRAKLKMELIDKVKSRNTTFKKRKEGLIRKLHEFSTLCDVNACMIIYAPPNNHNHNHNHNHIQPEIFPSHNSDQVRRIIDLYKYKSESKSNNAIKSSDIIDFFHDRNKQIEEEVAKLRCKNLEAKYPTRPDLLAALSEPQLRQLHARLTDKADRVKTLIALLRGKNSMQPTSSMPPPPIPQSAAANTVDFGEIMNQQQAAAMEMLTDHHRMQRQHAFNHNHPSANIQLIKHQVFFEYAPPPPPQQYVLPPFPPQLQRPYMLPAVVQPQYFGVHDQTARNQNLDGEQDHQDFGVNNFFSY